MEHKLLLVEDEEHLAFTLEFNLTQEGYEVVVARSLEEARAAMSSVFSLLLLDVMLPDGDGFAFCRALRADDCRTPVLFLTAKGTPDDIVAGLEAGGDDYITKPFVLKELLARIAAILRRNQWHFENKGADISQGPALDFDVPESYTFGNATIHFANHTAEIAGKEINFTALEYRLLGFFVAHENQVVSREDLLQHVWEVAPGNSTRTVDNFLVRLRRSFEQDPSKPRHFLTVRGIGYRFVGDPS